MIRGKHSAGRKVYKGKGGPVTLCERCYGRVSSFAPMRVLADGSKRACHLDAKGWRVGAASSARATWCTPEPVRRGLELLGPCALDPCSNPWSLVKAAIRLQVEPVRHVGNCTGTPCRCARRGVHRSDGLAFVWGNVSGGFVYVNPPYGKAMPQWAEKVASEAAAGVEIVSLIPARLGSAWYRSWTASASALCFVRGRLRFEQNGKPGDSAFFPSALVYHGPRAAAFCKAFAELGDCFELSAGVLTRGAVNAPSLSASDGRTLL